METTALTLPQRAAVALGSPAYETKLRELAAKSADILVITNDAGYQQVHACRMALKNARLAVEKTGKLAREDAQAYAKAIIGEQNRLVAIGSPEEDRLLALQQAWDDAEAAKKEALIRAEQERVSQVNIRILALETTPAGLVGQSAAAIKAALDTLTGMHPDGWADEFRPTADELLRLHTAYAKALADVERMHTAAVETAAEAKRQSEERAKLERERAEFEERQRQAQEQAAAAERARLAAEAESRRKIEAEEAAARKRVQEEEDRLRAARQQEEDRLAAQRREVEDAQRRQREADEARERAAREAQEAKDREARRAEEERQQAEAARLRAEQEARDTAERERLRLETEQADGRRAINLFIARFQNLPQFAPVVKAMFTWLEKNPERKAA